MSYLLLIAEPAGQRTTRTEAEGRDLYERMERFSADLKARGLLTLSHSLKGDSSGARVHRRGSETVVIDGPFTEAKEMIGGFFMLTCQSMEHAVAIARECPAAEWATVEVRELGPCFG